MTYALQNGGQRDWLSSWPEEAKPWIHRNCLSPLNGHLAASVEQLRACLFFSVTAGYHKPFPGFKAFCEIRTSSNSHNRKPDRHLPLIRSQAYLKWQSGSPHGATSWRLDAAACGPDWTTTFLADLFNTVEKRCHYHWLFLTWVRGHDEISHLHFRAEEACASAGATMSAMIPIFFAVLASFRLTSRPCRDQHNLLCRGFESGG